ncbi:hypothetical protein TorRG33x02_116750 [Trema orientale]|uniref:Uncharacterized protein n=1 Tax=Trema orientale TaxID=63057 RepID=A0A2P5F453_TREOI|nr:hypothetical protein TorRG33x02_116750 [Trema orientale]
MAESRCWGLGSSSFSGKGIWVGQILVDLRRNELSRQRKLKATRKMTVVSGNTEMGSGGDAYGG